MTRIDKFDTLSDIDIKNLWKENPEEFLIVYGEFPYDDFALLLHEDKLYVVYAYDGGYAYPCFRLKESDLLQAMAEEAKLNED